MRALVVGPRHAWSTADVARGWLAGLSAIGVETWFFNLSDQLAWMTHAEVEGETLDPLHARAAVSLTLLGEVYRTDPDVVVIVHGADVDSAAVRSIRCPVVLVLTECPYEAENQLRAAAAMEPALILVNDPIGADAYAQVAPTHYVPHAYDPAVHHPGDGERKHDAVFVGSGFPNRVDFLSAVDWTGIDLVLAGTWSKVRGTDLEQYVAHDDLAECVDNVTATAPLYRASRCGFNIYRTDSYGTHSTADGWAIGPRDVELPACGVWMPRPPRPEADELFPMLPTFSEPAELGELIRWALAHPDQRQAQADAARAAVADRTFANNAARTLRRLGL